MADRAAALAEEDFTTSFLRDPAATIVGMSSEDILLDAGHFSLDEAPESVETAGRVQERITLNNKVRGIETELEFVDDGCLHVTVKRRRDAAKVYKVDLRYLNPRPLLSKTNPVQLRKYALRFAVASGFGVALAWLTGSWILALVALAVSAATAGITACLIYQSCERVTFRTRHGNAAVLNLYASLGCARDCRALVPKIVSAISGWTRQQDVKDELYLRREIKEHYRLRDEGVLADPDCSAATRRVLSHFDQSRQGPC
jgi:hypothetical protein